MGIGQLLETQLRLKKKLNKKLLSGLIEVSEPTLNKIFMSEVAEFLTLEKFKRICEVLEINPRKAFDSYLSGKWEKQEYYAIKYEEDKSETNITENDLINKELELLKTTNLFLQEQVRFYKEQADFYKNSKNT